MLELQQHEVWFKTDVRPGRTMARPGVTRMRGPIDTLRVPQRKSCPHCGEQVRLVFLRKSLYCHACKEETRWSESA